MIFKIPHPEGYNHEGLAPRDFPRERVLNIIKTRGKVFYLTYKPILDVNFNNFDKILIK